MPKLGMEPIRREQICSAAATVISRNGFAGTTMRKVAEEAGVSTGMLNHYFANRQDLLIQTLTFVSVRSQARFREAIEKIPAGRGRLEAMLDSALAGDPEMVATWRVWINSYGEAVHVADLRGTIEGRLHSWYELIDFALEGLVPEDEPDSIPWSWRFDAILNGLAVQAFASEARLEPEMIRDEVIRLLLPGEAMNGTEATDARPAVSDG